MTVSGHAPTPFPSLPCLPNRSPLRVFPPIAPAGSSEAFWDTGRPLQCLHLDPGLSLPAFPTPLANSSVPSWRPFPAAVSDHHTQLKAPARAGRASVSNGSSRHVGLFHVEPEARTSPSPPPQPV